MNRQTIQLFHGIMTNYNATIHDLRGEGGGDARGIRP